MFLHKKNYLKEGVLTFKRDCTIFFRVELVLTSGLGAEVVLISGLGAELVHIHINHCFLKFTPTPVEIWSLTRAAWFNKAF